MDKNLTKTINILSRRIQMCISNTLKKYDLTAAEQPFFMALIKNEGVTQDELTSIVCVDKSAATRVMKSLTEKGYIIREQDKNDKRQNRVYQTEKAKQISYDVKKELIKLNDMITYDIDLDKLDIIFDALMKMSENTNLILKNKEV